MPIPALAEVQVALENAVAEVTGLAGYEPKKIMRTGTVATIDNRNWELVDHPRAGGAAEPGAGDRARHGERDHRGQRLPLPGALRDAALRERQAAAWRAEATGMATDFYKRQVAQHLQIGIRAMEALRDMPLEKLHSRKLRSFDETAFL